MGRQLACPSLLCLEQPHTKRILEKNAKNRSARFKTISQRLADQVRTIIKKGWFSEFEILEEY